MTSVNVTENKYSVSVTEGVTTVVTVKAPGPQGIQGATGAGISAGDKGSLTVAANLTDWTLNDSVVTNAKVSASAAIAGTKINPFFTSNITISNSHPQLFLTDIDNNSDFKIQNLNGVFGIRDQTNDVTRFSITSDGTATLANNLIVSGNMSVSGTTTTINTQTLDVEDINVTLGKVGSPTDITANNGGISLLGDTTKTFNWLNATDSWTSSEHIALPDNKKLQLGDSQDLQLYHNGSTSYITDNGTGSLIINSVDGNIELRVNNTESAIKCIENGAVSLYHDNVKRCETSADGLNLPDNSKLQLGDNQDLAIFHDGSNSRIQDSGTGFLLLDTNTLMIRKVDGSETMAKFVANGSAELYYDNSLRLGTRSWGVEVPNQTFQAANLVAFGGYVHVNQDNQPVKVGVGSDLSLLHDGTDSFIENITGNLHIRPKAGEEGIKLFPDGSVYLYYNNEIKLTTASWGVSVWGVLQANNLEASNGYVWVKHDNQPVKVGVGGDLSLLHDGTDSKITNITGNLLIEPKSGETGIKLTPDAGVELFYDNVKRAETLSTSFNIYGKAYVAGEIASFNCRFLQNGTDLHIDNNNGGTANRYTQISGGTLGTDSGFIRLYNAGQVELYHNSVKRFNTTADAVDVHGHLNLGANTDNKKLRFGINNDLEIFHDGSNSVIKDAGTGMLKILGSTVTIKNGGDTETMASFIPNGAVNLFFDNAKKFETTSSGITVQGSVTTEDMNMSNLNGTANEVDSTKGSWSIQEGADDLFIINRVSGKKYKFNLTEIS